MWEKANDIPGVTYAAYRTPDGVHLRTGGRVVAYVRSGGIQEHDPVEVKNKLVTTMNVALGRCRSGYGDVVVVLNGHAENVASADAWSNLVAGTKIIGMGTGLDRPTFTWTTATSTVLIDVANVVLDNMIFEMAGPAGTTALSVALPMTVSGSGFQIRNCVFHTEIDADQQATVGVRFDAADDGVIDNCYFYGSGDGSVTATVQIDACDRLKCYNTVFEAYSAAVGTGVVQFVDAASYQSYFKDCTFINRLAASTECVLGLGTCTGWVIDCDFFKNGDDDIAVGTAWTTSTLMQFAGCRVCNLATENAGTATTLST